GGGRGGVGIEIELALLEMVLHIAASAVDLLVEISGRALGAGQRGDDEAGISFTLGELSFPVSAASSAPAAARPIREFLEVSCRLAGLSALRLGPHQFAPDRSY